MRVLFVSPEAEPLAKTGGLADVVGSLPKYLAELGHEVKIIIPRYRICQKNKNFPQKRLPFEITVPIGQAKQIGRVYSVFLTRNVEVWLIENDLYFDRSELYQEDGRDYPDNAERFIFFNRAVLEFLKKAGWPPDVIHCHDWQTALIPVYLKSLYKNDKFFKKCRTVYTIHNMGYQGVFDKFKILLAGLGWEYFTYEQLEYWDQFCFAKGGLIFADKVTTVSPSYSLEIQTPEFGAGLDGVLKNRAKDVSGILNGIDYDYWNPATDPDIVRNYNAKSLDGKGEDKKNLQAAFSLSEEAAIPLIGIISRLADQKGFDILAAVLPQLLRLKLEIVVLGTGDPWYHQLFSEMAKKFPQKLGVALRFDSPLSRKIYAGSDFFLMPSKYEPCGLGQMISLRYGTIPIVRATGGLADTIENFNPKNLEGNGFSFTRYSGQALLEAVKNALKIYKNKEIWTKLLKNALGSDFSWEASAKKYSELYASLFKRSSKRVKATGLLPKIL